MKSLPVSVIIPTYNRAGLIMRAVNSALRECIPGDEIIVVDDGSIDNTEQILSTYAEPLRYYKTSNSGAGAARNLGIQKSHNPLVAFLDSDDEWMPGKLMLQRAFMEACPEVLFSFTNFAVTFKTGGEAHNFLINWHNDPRPWDEILGARKRYSEINALPNGVADFNCYRGDIYPSLLRISYCNTDTVVVRRNDAGSALQFAEDLKWGEDWFCYSNLARKGQAAYLDFESAWQHGHEGVRLTDTDILNGIITRMTIMERIWGADSEFLGKHGQIYKKLLDEQRCRKISELIASGRTAEARSELKLVDSAPLSYRFLAAMPQGVVRTLVAGRRLLRSRLGAR
jgi:glycosyltransferase involved in cell wall biosynthesis